MIERLDNENADLDINAAEALVLTHTPDATYPMQCQAVVYLGDGAKDLDGSGGNFTFRVNLGSQIGTLETVTFGTEVRKWWQSDPFVVPANTEVKVYVQSPNAADTDVDVTADLYALCRMDAIAISGNMTTANNLETNAKATGMELADDAIKAAKYDETTAFPVKSADTGATQIARVGADSDTLETVSDEIDSVAAAIASLDLDVESDVQTVVPLEDTHEERERYGSSA